MKKLLLFLILLPLFGCGQSENNKSFTTQLKGTVTGRDSEALYLLKGDDMPREINPDFVINIEDGKFEYTLSGEHIQKYELVFMEEFLRGSMSVIIDFFPDADTVYFELYGEEHEQIVSGGGLNKKNNEYKRLRKELFEIRMEPIYEELDNLYDNDAYHSDEGRELYRQLDELYERDAPGEEMLPMYAKLDEMRRTKKDLSEVARELTDRLDTLRAEQDKWQADYIVENPDLVSYSMFIKKLYYLDYRDEYDVAEFEKIYAVLSAANPGHPYNEQARDMINAFKTVVPGGAFVDFTAPDLDGNMYTLSEEIAGKVAVIDLWASWCSPCRLNSKQMIPLYEKYHDEGFTIVGVAREYNDTQALEEALKRDGYPWLNLVELDDRARLWDKYGISNAAGGVFLVDEKGKIIMMKAEVEKIAEYLKERFD